MCDDCRNEFSALELTWNALGALPVEKPSPDLEFRFSAMLDGYIRGEKNSKPVQSWRKRLQSWWQVPHPAFQIALAVLLLATGFGLGRLQPSRSELTQLKREVTEMRQVLMLSMLNQPSPLTRLGGINLSRQLPEPNPEIISALLQTIEVDPNVNVRLAAIDALTRFEKFPRIGGEMLKALPRQNSPLVQIAMIDFLIARKNHGVLTVFQKLVQENTLNPAVKSHLQWGIEQLI